MRKRGREKRRGRVDQNKSKEKKEGNELREMTKKIKEHGKWKENGDEEILRKINK